RHRGVPVSVRGEVDRRLTISLLSKETSSAASSPNWASTSIRLTLRPPDGLAVVSDDEGRGGVAAGRTTATASRSRCRGTDSKLSLVPRSSQANQGEGCICDKEVPELYRWRGRDRHTTTATHHRCGV